MSYSCKSKEIRIRIKSKSVKAIILVAILLAVVLYFVINHFDSIQKLYVESRPIFEIKYHGIPMKFREDIRLAKNIEVYPNETYLKSIFRNKEIRGVTIGILNYTNQTNIIGVESVEITFKLSSFYSLASIPVIIKGKEIGSLSEISGNSTNPVIIIIPPSIANETLVRVENYTVFISGKSLKELDLATIKFIALVLGI